MIMLLQIVVLIIGVGGAIVSALTLPDSRAKWLTVTSFGILGLIGFALTILTYEEITISAAAGAIAGLFQNVSSHVQPIFQRWGVQIAVALLIGIFIGVLAPREYQKRTRVWYGKQDIEIHFASPTLVSWSLTSRSER